MYIRWAMYGCFACSIAFGIGSLWQWICIYQTIRKRHIIVNEDLKDKSKQKGD